MEKTTSVIRSRIPVPKFDSFCQGTINNQITISPLISPTSSPSRIPVPIKNSQVPAETTSTGSASPQLCSPTSSMSSSQILSSALPSPMETPKHSHLFIGKEDELKDVLPAAGLCTSFDTASLQQSQPTSDQHTNLVFDTHQRQTVLSDFMRSTNYQFNPSVLYNIPTDTQLKSAQDVHQRTTSNESIGCQSDHSTLSLSSLSIPSKLSILSAANNRPSAASLMSQTLQETDSDKRVKPFLTSTQLSSLSATKLQIQIELEKETVKKELEEATSTMEFLEHENRLIQEKCSNIEVDNSSLQLKIAQLEEQLDRMRQQYREEQEKVIKSEEQEKMTLLDHISQVVQEKEALTDKLLTIQKEHEMCSQHMRIASTVSSDTDKQLNTLRISLQESQERVRQLQDALRNAEIEKENFRRGFELEKSHLMETKSSFTSLKQSLEVTSKKLEESQRKCFQKDELLSQKESQLSVLQGELKITKDSYRSVIGRHDSLALDVQVLQQDLENKKKQLVEVLQRKETGETSIRDLNEKLSSFERETKEREASFENEMKERKQLEAEIVALRQKCQDLEQQLALKHAATSKQERVMASKIVEKEALESLVAEKETQLRCINLSRGHEVSELKNLVSAMEAKNRTQCELIEEKEEAMKSLTLQKKTLECSLEFEKEQKTSLNQSIAYLKEELETIKQQSQALENEKHNMSLTATTKAKTSTETESFMRKQIEVLEIETKSKEVKLHSTAVQLTQKEAELERALGKMSDLQTQVALLNADVDNNKKLVESLKLKLQRFQESKNQEISEVKQKFEDKCSEVVRLLSQVDSLQFELREKEEAIMKGREEVQQEKKRSEEIRAQLLTSETGGSSLRSHLSQSTERVKKLEIALAEKKAQLQAVEEKNHSLSLQLQNMQRNQHEVQKINSDERGHFTDTLSSMSVQHSHEMAKITQSMESLQLKLKEMKVSLDRAEQLLKVAKSELSSTAVNLKNKEEECRELYSSVEREIASRNETITKLTSLQTQYDSLCNDRQSMKEQLTYQSNELSQTQVKLSSVQQHCARLQQELQLQSEVHTTSTRRLEERERESSGQYERKIKELTIKLEKSEGTVQEMASELSRVQLDHGTLQSQLSHVIQVSENLQSQLTEKRAHIASDKQKLGQLERSMKQEKLTKTQTQESLTREVGRHHELKTKVDHLKEKLSQSVSSKGSVEARLEDEKMNAMLLQEKISELENVRNVLEVTLKKEKESSLTDRQKAESDQATIKKKYQSEKKILKDTLKGLQSEVQILRSTIDSHSKEITKLDKALNTAELEKDKLSDKKTDIEKLLREKKEMVKLAEAKIQSQEVQLSQLQVQVNSLHHSQLDLEEYKKAMETKQRDELQRILTEVTEHMEEQYSAHHYLEKLRADNESLAMKEKDRKIGHLRNELKAQKKELKKEKLQVESLSLEAKYLKAKQKEHERSREKVGARIEKVNSLLSSNTIGISSASASLSTSMPLPSMPLPISTSTPLIRKSLQ